MTKEHIIKGIADIRKSLKPVLNDRFNKVLSEAERLLAQVNAESLPAEKPTHEQLVNKYFFK